MPRKSAAALSVANLDTRSRRVRPPESLPASAKLVWVELVDSLPADRFHPSDRPLLALYCRALHQAGLAFEAIETHGATSGDSINPAVRVADAAVKQAATLATKLRLCPQSRLDRKVAGPAARNDESGPRPWEPPAPRTTRKPNEGQAG